MGSVADFERICRLCGLECYDLINLYEAPVHERNLVAIIKKYVKVTVGGCIIFTTTLYCLVQSVSPSIFLFYFFSTFQPLNFNTYR